MSAASEARIRLLGPGDEPLLNQLAEEDNLFDEDPGSAPSGALTFDGARDFLADPAVLLWVAEHGNEAVGFLHCFIQRRRSAGPWAELLLMEMGTHHSRRRQGVGRAMLGAMEDWMAVHGVAEVWVPANTYAVGFYEKCGFRKDEGEILVKALA